MGHDGTPGGDGPQNDEACSGNFRQLSFDLNGSPGPRPRPALNQMLEQRKEAEKALSDLAIALGVNRAASDLEAYRRSLRCDDGWPDT